MGMGIPGPRVPRDPAQGGGRPLALTDHDDAEDEVADLLQELRPERQQQPGHHLHPAHHLQVPARIRHEPEILQGKDLGKLHELRLLGKARGERSCPEPRAGGAQPLWRGLLRSALRPGGLIPFPRKALPCIPWGSGWLTLKGSALHPSTPTCSPPPRVSPTPQSTQPSAPAPQPTHPPSQGLSPAPQHPDGFSLFPLCPSPPRAQPSTPTANPPPRAQPRTPVSQPAHPLLSRAQPRTATCSSPPKCSAPHRKVLTPAWAHPRTPKNSAPHPNPLIPLSQGLSPAPQHIHLPQSAQPRTPGLGPAPLRTSAAPAAPPHPAAALTMCRCRSAESCSESFAAPVSRKKSPSRTRRAVNAAAMAGTGGDGGGRGGRVGSAQRGSGPLRAPQPRPGRGRQRQAGAGRGRDPPQPWGAAGAGGA